MTKMIAWVEVPAENFKRAVDFYREVLKTEFSVFDCDSEKMACFPGGEGAVSYASDFKPSKDGVLVSFTVPDNMQSTMERIKNHGGSILRSKTKIDAEGRGYFAIFIDSEGNKVGLYGDE